MNALWIARLCAYRGTSHSILSAGQIVSTKVKRRGILLKKYRCQPYLMPSSPANSLQAVLLNEARAAKYFWNQYAGLMPKWCNFESRKPRHGDLVNRLLDIGYRHLTRKVANLIKKQGISPAMGILHKPRNADSAPLAYDLVELFRADVIDAEALRFLRLKKQPIHKLNPVTIAHFLHEVNERLEKRHYLRSFRQCHTYYYYMELQVLKFIAAVNSENVFHPLHLPARHDSRCR